MCLVFHKFLAALIVFLMQRFIHFPVLLYDLGLFFDFVGQSFQSVLTHFEPVFELVAFSLEQRVSIYLHLHHVLFLLVLFLSQLQVHFQIEQLLFLDTYLQLSLLDFFLFLSKHFLKL